MKMPYLLLAIPGSILATIVAIAACAPRSTTIPVEIKPRTPLGQALEDCVSQVRQSQTFVVQGRTTSVCMVPDGLAPSEGGIQPFPLAKSQTSEGAGEASEYRLVTQPVRYSISNPSGRLRVGLTIGVHLPKEYQLVDQRGDAPSSTDEKMRLLMNQNLTWILGMQCAPKIQRVWSRSNIDLNLQFKTVTSEADNSVDQHVRLIAAGTSGELPRLKVAAWPDRGDLVPFAQPEDEASCGTEKTSDGYRKCYEAKVMAANERFCLNVALMVGRWVGLEGDALKSSKCTAEKTVADVRPSYMKAASRAEEQSTFWQSAQLSSTDLKTLLSPICRSFQRKDVSLHSNLAAAH